MKLTLLAGLTACLAITVQAGGSGGRGGDIKVGPTGPSGHGGRGGDAGGQKSGDSHAKANGNAGNIGGVNNYHGAAGGNGGTMKTVIGAPIGPQVVYGNVGSYVGNNIGNGDLSGGSTGGNTFTSNNQGAQANGPNAQSTSGAAKGGTAGKGASSGSTGNKLGGNKTGDGGKGGDSTISVPVTPLPKKRSLDARGAAPKQIDVAEIVNAINANQKLPTALEAEISHSHLAQQYNIPANRGPINPQYATMDCSAAIKVLASGNIPAEVTAAMNSKWAKKGTASHAAVPAAGQKAAHGAGVASKTAPAPRPQAAKAGRVGGRRAVAFMA